MNKVNPIVETVKALLASGRFREYQLPLDIDGILFEVDAAFSDPDSNQLIVVLSADGTKEAASLARWTVDRLGQALDMAGSYRTLSVVLISEGEIDVSSRIAIARVAQLIGVSAESDLPLESQLAPLLPLAISIRKRATEDALGRLRSASSSTETASLLDAAGENAKAVEDRFRSILDSAFEGIEDL